MPKQTFFNLPEDKQQRITDCAIDEFADHGYGGASISRLVASAGIAKGSFYQYFEDKEDLYGYIINSAIVERKMRVRDEEAVKLEDLTLTQFVRVLFQNMMSEFAGRPKLLKISIDFLRHQYGPVQRRIYNKYKHLGDNYFTAFIDFEKAQGELDPNVDSEVLSGMLTGINYLISGYAAQNGYEALTLEYIDGLVDKIEYILINGVYKGIDN